MPKAIRDFDSESQRAPNSELFIDPIPNQTPEVASKPESKASSNA